MPGRTRQAFTKQEKQDVVRRVLLDGETQAAVARATRIHLNTVNNWVTAAKRDPEAYGLSRAAITPQGESHAQVQAQAREEILRLAAQRPEIVSKALYKSSEDISDEARNPRPRIAPVELGYGTRWDIPPDNAAAAAMRNAMLGALTALRVMHPEESAAYDRVAEVVKNLGIPRTP